MRWFVEVSRVGENGVADEYCVEAKQWQAALQEARKLRGDTGALSKFSIELLDRGYRAVDPALKLRYLINEAPPDAPLTGSSESAKKHTAKSEHATGKPPPVEVTTSSVYATSLAPTPFTTSLAPPATSSAAPRPSYPAPRPSSIAPARSALSEPPRVTPSEAPRAAAVEPSRPSRVVVPDDPVPPAPPPPGIAAPSAPPAPPVPKFELVRERAEEPRADSPITYREFAYAVEPGKSRAEIEALLQDRYRATRAAIEDRPPGKFAQIAVFDHVFKRRPERPPLATFAWKDWRGEPTLAFPGFGEEAMPPASRVPAARESISPPSNGVASAARTSVAPEPARVVPIKPVVISSVPPPPAKPIEPVPVPPPANPPAIELDVPIEEAAAAPSVDIDIPIEEAAAAPAAEVDIPIEETAPAKEATSSPAEHAPVVAAPPTPSVPPAPETAPAVTEGGRPNLAEVPSISAVTAATAEVAERALSSPAGSPAPLTDAPATVVEGGRAEVVAEPVVAAEAPPAPSFELHFEAPVVQAVPPPGPSSATSAARASRPRIAAEGRRRAGEDLIGELFEIMHDLHFAGDVAEGAEFVLSVLDELLPCEGVLIHVFDINTGHFVVVRAKGPNAASSLLQRMSDQDPLVRSVMRSTHAMSVKNATDDARFGGPRWQALGVTPRAALCGGVQLGGRYLGLIELANPLGDVPFHQSELNALDYICEQFAAFLSKKPIVLSADVILSRG